MSTKIFVLLEERRLRLAEGRRGVDFLQRFGLEQILEREVAKLCSKITPEHFANFHFFRIVEPAVDRENVFRAGWFLQISFNELDLLIGNQEGRGRFRFASRHFSLQIAIEGFWVTRIIIFLTPLRVRFVKLAQLSGSRLADRTRNLGWENRLVPLVAKVV